MQGVSPVPFPLRKNHPAGRKEAPDPIPTHPPPPLPSLSFPKRGPLPQAAPPRPLQVRSPSTLQSAQRALQPERKQL